MLLSLIVLLGCGEKEPVDTHTPIVETGLDPDADGDGVVASEDCDDADPTVYPGAEELCDELDQDCDDEIDEGVTSSFWLDADEDGYGNPDFLKEGCSAPEGYVDNGDDCNDADEDWHPGATEDDCSDPNDYNCDGSVSYEDADGDGTAACEDCDDSDKNIGPGELELCDGRDNDCDGEVDNEPIDGERYYADSDDDGYGDADVSSKECALPEGYAANDDDCDDTEPSAYPGNSESCDGIDNDCDGDVDEGEGSGSLWYQDKDGDGYGTPYSTKTACLQPSGYVDNDDDCNDNSSSVTVASTWYADADGDGYGDSASTTAACTQPSAYVSDSQDCDDTDSAINPDATELCDSADNDCDGTTDEDDAADANLFYADSDGDGEGDSASTTTSCSSSVSGYVTNDEDCDDSDSAINTSATEVCDSSDNDCDGTVDEDDASNASTWYADSDGDSYGDSAVTTVACNQPSAYVSDDTDCDDTDSSVNPGATEACNGVDDDCDTQVDEGFTGTPKTWYADSDGDGEGDGASTTVDCNQPTGYVANDDDCDDTDSSINTSGTEVCDSSDNDCDGTVDESDATDASTWTIDADGDGYGSDSGNAATQVACDQPSGYAASTDDCDDGDSAISPAATEVCDDTDNDCDGDIDDDDSSVTGQTTWTIDADGDGFGSSATNAATTDACDQPSGYADNTDDCDDTDASIEDAITWYSDSDGDGEGDPSSTVASCTQPSGAVANSDDCDDTDSSVNTSASEYCDSIDNDCDGDTDENDAVDVSTFYADSDSDGYGDSNSTTQACSAPTGYVADDTDCDDDANGVNPGASEVCDSLDNDCDGDIDDDDSSVSGQTTWTVDGDGDGFGDINASSTQTACDQPSGYVNDDTDCDDAEASTYPNAPEYCDTVDNDCDGTTDESDAVDATDWYIDSDGDGYGDENSLVSACTQPSGYQSIGGDCDDADSGVNPGEDEYCDTVDNDCDGDTDEDDAVDATTWYADDDADGYGDPNAGNPSCAQPTNTVSDNTDCDDTDVTTYPGASEVCYDGIVNDCNGTVSAALAQCTLSGSVTLNTATRLLGQVDLDTLGTSVFGPGDIDGDGYADLLTGAPGDDGSATNGGAVYLTYGPMTSGTIAPDATVESGTTNHHGFGARLAWFDFDGDGTEDLIGAATGTNGAVYVMQGPLSGSSATSSAYATLQGESSDDQPGRGLSVMADHDGDGVSDLLIGAPNDDDFSTNSGAVYLVYGIPTGTSSLASYQKVVGEAINSVAGFAVTGEGDFDGDGTDDVVIGAYGYSNKTGRAYLFYGPVTASVSSVGSADLIIEGDNTQDRLGAALALRGDFDGDGTDDLVLGAPYDDASTPDAGIAFVLFGNTTSSGTLYAADTDLGFYGKGTNDHTGSALSYVSDIDGDGKDELLLAAPDQKNNGAASGVVYLTYGSSTSMATGATINSGAAGDGLGWALDVAGDTDGNGVVELALGAAGVDGATTSTDKGALYLLGVAAY